MSDILKQKNVPSHFMPDLLNEYMDSLYLMQSFLDFTEVLNIDQTAWAYALEELTGVEAATLLDARADALGPNRAAKSYDLPLPSPASDLEAYIHRTKNKVVPPPRAGLEARQFTGERKVGGRGTGLGPGLPDPGVLFG